MNEKHLSIMFSTYNRSDCLRQTLEAMCEVDRDGLNVEFVVVDNNSNDDTEKVIDSFVERLPLRHLFESRPGKNCALNHALDNVELGQIVVFTDDDIVPCRDWLKEIVSACKRWPEYNLFGGKVELIWPNAVEIPKWARENVRIRIMGFAEHDRGTQIKPYEGDDCPFGPNFWVRRSVFSAGLRFDESVGPSPRKSFRMGSETEFLIRLVAEGNRALYVGYAAVGHHVERKLLVPHNMLMRAIRSGRGKVPTAGLPEPELLAKSPWRWKIQRMVSITKCLIWRLRAQLHRDECIRMKKKVEALRSYAYHFESLFMSWNSSSAKNLENRDHSSNNNCAMVEDTSESRGRSEDE